jgi:hypothetical protein
MPQLDPYAVPAGVGGYLEWSSGTLFVNESLERWEAFRSRTADMNDPRTLQFLQTITHETFHFLQIATAGFPYQFACLMFSELKEIIRPPLDEARLRALMHDPPPPSRRLAFLGEFLDEQGPGGITTRDIIESAAFMYEHRIHYPDISFKGYGALLHKRCPAPEYRAAYDLMEQKLGERAFDLCLPLCFAALCFCEPNLVFSKIVEAARGLAEPSQGHVDTIRQVCAIAAAKHAPLGTAAEVAFEGTSPFGRLSHPIYTEAVVALNENANNANPVELVCQPSALGATAAEAVVRPILLKGGALWVPSSLYSRSQTEPTVRTRLEASVRLGAIGLGVVTKRMNVARFRTFA